MAVNSDFTYEITVKNTGKTDLKDVVVSDTAPQGVTLSNSSTGKIDGSKWTHTIANLPAGQSQTFSLTAKYAKFIEGKHKNTACVDTPTIAGSPAPTTKELPLTGTLNTASGILGLGGLVSVTCAYVMSRRSLR